VYPLFASTTLALADALDAQIKRGFRVMFSQGIQGAAD
jgi:hypothetical protein